MKGVVCLVLLLVCACTTTYANTADILVDASTNIINGVVAGFQANEVNNTVEASCVNSVSLLYAVDDFVSLMLNTSNTTVNIITSQLQVFSNKLAMFLILPLKACNFPTTIVQPIADAIPLLGNVQGLNYSTASLIVNKVDLYETIASLVGEYSNSNFHSAGFYLGVALRMLSGLPSGQLNCQVQDDAVGALTAMYGTLLQKLGEFADIGEGEKVIFDFNTGTEWGWCGGPEKNYTVCDPANNYYTYDIITTLDSLTQYTARVINYMELFSNMYTMYVSSINTFDPDLDEEMRQIEVLSREADNRYNRDIHELEPIYEAYVNSTQNAANITYWMSDICKLPLCAATLGEMAKMQEYLEQIIKLETTAPGFVVNAAMDAISDPQYQVTYLTFNGYNATGLGYDISLMPNQYVQNQQAGLYQGGIYFSASRDYFKEQLCTSDFNLPATVQQELQEKGMLQFNKNGTWHNVEVDWLHDNFTYSLSARSFTRVKANPTGWFDPNILWRFRNATDIAGKPGSYYFDPDHGIFSSMVTGVLVATDVEIKVFVSEQSGKAMFDKFGDVVDGIKFGPFFVNGIQYSYGDGGVTVTLNTPGQTVPQILGYVIKQLPFSTN